MQQALVWHLRLRDADAEQWRTFANWLGRDPAHNAAYESVAERAAGIDSVLGHAAWAAAGSK